MHSSNLETIATSADAGSGNLASVIAGQTLVPNAKKPRTLARPLKTCQATAPRSRG